MIAMWMMTVFGLAIGGAAGGMSGAAAGGVVGMLLGFPVWARERLRLRPRDVVPIIERHAIMCFPYGHAAECELEGDGKRGRWYDVVWCSIKKDRPRCDKGCVQLLNAAGVRPGQRCDCEEPTTRGSAG